MYPRPYLVPYIHEYMIVQMVISTMTPTFANYDGDLSHNLIQTYKDLLFWPSWTMVVSIFDCDYLGDDDSTLPERQIFEAKIVSK